MEAAPVFFLEIKFLCVSGVFVNKYVENEVIVNQMLLQKMTSGMKICSYFGHLC